MGEIVTINHFPSRGLKRFITLSNKYILNSYNQPFPLTGIETTMDRGNKRFLVGERHNQPLPLTGIETTQSRFYRPSIPSHN